MQEIEDVLMDESFVGSGGLIDVPDGAGGTVQMVASPIDFSETNWAPQGPAPQLGAHTELILSDELGYGWETIVALKDEGIIL